MSEGASNVVNEPNVVDVNVVSEQSVCKRKLTSLVWNEFKKITDPNGVEWAICGHCKRKFSGDSKSGTTHLKNHLNRCLVKINKQKGQMELQTVVQDHETNLTKLQNFKFDQELSRKDLCKMVIKHNYSFNIVEHDLFNVFVQNLQPRFRVISRNTLRSDVMNLYESEKILMYKLLENNQSRISFTTDLWTCSSQNAAYCALTAHYVDNDWVLRKKILCFPTVLSKHDGLSLFSLIKPLLLEWNLEKKFFSITVDNATSNDVMTRHLRTWLNDLNVFPLNGSLFHVRCACHILNLIVQDGLKSIDGMLKKIRESVIYVNSSPQRKQQFNMLLSQLKLQKHKQPGDDVPTRWNSTYLMLESAILIKAVYARLEQLDPRYTLNPSDGEWEIGESVCKCLKIFYEATLKFSAVKYPTSSVYFSIVCGIQQSLLKWGEHDEAFICDMSNSMKLKFDKYWSETNMLMSLAVILDPRFKLAFVHYNLNEIYGIGCEMQLSNIKTALYSLFDEYNVSDAAGSSTSTSVTNNSSNPNVCDDVNVECIKNFNNWYSSTHNVNASVAQQNELVRYLEEPLFQPAGEFNILSWWHDNSLRYPTLGKMARDLLAVPVSSVASESAFSIGGNMIDPSRNHLAADVVQALMCSKDWIEVSGKVSRRRSSGAPLHP